MNFDVTIIGAGIVGLATAHKLLNRHPSLKVAVVEKESTVAAHQTGHNSGVIHSGIYYKPGSLKAINCQKGYYQLLDFCEKHDVQYELCGKVIVATNEEEAPRLDGILNRGLANGMKNIKMIDPAAVHDIEPHVNAVKAIHVPQAGIISYKDVALKYQELIAAKGGNFFFNEKVIALKQNGQLAIIETENTTINAKLVVNCAGLYADKIAQMTEEKLQIQVLPFRGEYYNLKKEHQYLVNHLIYPVPNPNFPFLGVHFTRMIKGGIEAGPNAVLAFKREGYSRWNINPAELFETIKYPGFQKLAKKYWRDGAGELYRSYSKSAFVKALQHLIPSIDTTMLERGGSGVRAMACDREGNMVEDYLVLEKKQFIHVLNAPSPAATSSLAIGSFIVDKICKRDYISQKTANL